MVSIGCLLQTRVIEEVLGGIGGGLLKIPSSNNLETLWTKKKSFFFMAFTESSSLEVVYTAVVPLLSVIHDGRLEEVLQSNMNSQHL